jgi:hypothetical protein
VDQVLGLHPIAMRSFSFGQPYSYPAADLGFLPATLSYEGFSEERVFSVASDHVGSPPQIRVYGSELAREGRPVAASPEDAANRMLLEVWAERSGRRALPYLAGELRERVARGEQVDLLEQGGTGPMLPLSSYQTGKVVAQDDTYRWVEATLDLGSQAGVKRFVKVTQSDGLWRVVALVNSLAGEPPPPDAFPGPGWTAWKQGDFNGDGRQETVYLIESGAIHYDRLEDPLLNASSLNATAVMVAQDGPGGPEVLLQIDGQSVRAANGYEVSFGASGPAFFQVAVTYAYEGRFLHVLPLKDDGYAHSQALAFKWSPTAGGYRPIGGPHGE